MWKRPEKKKNKQDGLLQKTRYKAPTFPDIASTSRLFLKLVKIITGPFSRIRRSEQLSELLEEVKSAEESTHDVLLLKCLRREVQRGIKL